MFNSSLENPFTKQGEYGLRNYTWHHKIPCERSIELEFGKINQGSLLSISLSTDFKGRDHAGPSLEISLFNYGFILEFPKGRHWNYEKDCFLENYNVWMEKTSKLFEKKYPNDEFLDYLFQEYYEGGNSPEEAIKKYHDDSNYEEDNNPFCDLYPNFETYYKECVDILGCDIDRQKLTQYYSMELEPKEAIKMFIEEQCGELPSDVGNILINNYYNLMEKETKNEQ